MSPSDALDDGRVQGQVVGGADDVLDAVGDGKPVAGRQHERRVDGQRRVIADDLHAEVGRRVGHERADGAEPDDAERFTLDLLPGE